MSGCGICSKVRLCCAGTERGGNKVMVMHWKGVGEENRKIKVKNKRGNRKSCFTGSCGE